MKKFFEALLGLLCCLWEGMSLLYACVSIRLRLQSYAGFSPAGCCILSAWFLKRLDFEPLINDDEYQNTYVKTERTRIFYRWTAHTQFIGRREAVLRNNCAKGSLAKKLTTNNWVLEGPGYYKNYWTRGKETQLFLTFLYK